MVVAVMKMIIAIVIVVNVHFCQMSKILSLFIKNKLGKKPAQNQSR